jgi:hypothetical protein
MNIIRRIRGNYRYMRIMRDGTSFRLLVHRDLDGHIATMHQSGTHWLKHMLTVAIARRYNLPLPQYIQNNEIIGLTKSRPIYPQIPQIVHSHTIPSPLLAWLAGKGLFRQPQYVLLIRDMRHSLASHYGKYQETYGVDFSTFLRHKTHEKRFTKDIWWDIRFLNSWDAMRRYLKDKVLVVHYEKLTAQPEVELRRIVDHLGLNGIDDETLRHAISESSKSAMKKKEKPTDGVAVVREDKTSALSRYSEDDKAYFKNLCERYLLNSFGYDYCNW